MLNQSNDLLIAFLLVLFESLWDRDRCLGEEFLNAGFAVAVLSAIVFIEDLTLFRGGVSEGGVDVPRAFVVLQCRVKICLNMCLKILAYEDVSTNLANVLGLAVAVEVVVLNLEVLAEGEKDFEGEVESSLVLNTGLIFAVSSDLASR